MADKQGKILIVDDERANINLLVNILKEHYQLIIARNGQEAIERAMGQNPPDIILLDIIMPGMNGYETCVALKRDVKTKHIPVIFITAVSEIMDETRGFSVGAVDYITKPFYPPVVMARVETHLSLKRAVDQLARQNEELREAARLREDVDSITRHDLQNPLYAIMGATELILEDKLADPQREMIEAVRSSAYKMSRMINMSLDLLKIERGIYNLTPSPIDLLKTLAWVTSEYESLARKNNNKVALTVNGAPPTETTEFCIQGEDFLCYSMLANLFLNAIEASPKGAKIEINLTHNEGSAFIEMINQGETPPEIRGRFFEKYITHGKGKGTGIGTYSAKLMAEAQHGSITLDTTTAGTTRLLIELPAAETGCAAHNS